MVGNMTATARQLCETVERTIRQCSIFEAPSSVELPPNDQSAERRIVAAILEGEPLAELGKLDAAWFYVDLHKRIMRHVLETGEVDFDAIAERFHRDGYHGPVTEWLQYICELTPFQGYEALRADVARVHELYCARVLLDKVAVIVGKLRAGTVATREALAELMGI